MQLEDRIYGSVDVDEPVLMDLLSSEAVRRLQGVLQHGVTALVGITEPVTRYDHSVGVMLLIRRLGGSLTEQVAGLLHDISHTAFSHVIDYVVDGHRSQSYHDEMKEVYLAGTDIPTILEQHGYDWRQFLEDELFPLLEQPAPRLCADRLDYFLRDSLELSLATDDSVHRVLSRLVVVDDRIMVNDLDTARWMAYTYMAADDASWASFREVGLYEVAAQAIRRGLEIGVITEADFWDQDAAVWARLSAHQDPILREKLALVTPTTRFVRDSHNPTFSVGTKLRTIDPDVLMPESPALLSTIDGAFARFRDAYLARKQGEWPIRVIAL